VTEIQKDLSPGQKPEGATPQAEPARQGALGQLVDLIVPRADEMSDPLHVSDPNAHLRDIDQRQEQQLYASTWGNVAGNAVIKVVSEKAEEDLRRRAQQANEAAEKVSEKEKKRKRGGVFSDTWFRNLATLIGPEAASEVSEKIERFCKEVGSGLDVTRASLTQLAVELTRTLQAHEVIDRLKLSPKEVETAIADRLEEHLKEVGSRAAQASPVVENSDQIRGDQQTPALARDTTKRSHSPFDHPIPQIALLLREMSNNQFILLPEALQMARCIEPIAARYNYRPTREQMGEMLHGIFQEVEQGRGTTTRDLRATVERGLDPKYGPVAPPFVDFIFDLAVRVQHAKHAAVVGAGQEVPIQPTQPVIQATPATPVQVRDVQTNNEDPGVVVRTGLGSLAGLARVYPGPRVISQGTLLKANPFIAAPENTAAPAYKVATLKMLQDKLDAIGVEGGKAKFSNDHATVERNQQIAKDVIEDNRHIIRTISKGDWKDIQQRAQAAERKECNRLSDEKQKAVAALEARGVVFAEKIAPQLMSNGITTNDVNSQYAEMLTSWLKELDPSLEVHKDTHLPEALKRHFQDQVAVAQNAVKDRDEKRVGDLLNTHKQVTLEAITTNIKKALNDGTPVDAAYHGTIDKQRRALTEVVSQSTLTDIRTRNPELGNEITQRFEKIAQSTEILLLRGQKEQERLRSEMTTRKDAFLAEVKALAFRQGELDVLFAKNKEGRCIADDIDPALRVRLAAEHKVLESRRTELLGSDKVPPSAPSQNLIRFFPELLKKESPESALAIGDLEHARGARRFSNGMAATESVAVESRISSLREASAYLRGVLANRPEVKDDLLVLELIRLGLSNERFQAIAATYRKEFGEDLMPLLLARVNKELHGDVKSVCEDGAINVVIKRLEQCDKLEGRARSDLAKIYIASLDGAELRKVEDHYAKNAGGIAKTLQTLGGENLVKWFGAKRELALQPANPESHAAMYAVEINELLRQPQVDGSVLFMLVQRALNTPVLGKDGTAVLLSGAMVNDAYKRLYNQSLEQGLNATAGQPSQPVVHDRFRHLIQAYLGNDQKVTEREAILSALGIREGRIDFALLQAVLSDPKLSAARRAELLNEVRTFVQAHHTFEAADLKRAGGDHLVALLTSRYTAELGRGSAEIAGALQMLKSGPLSEAQFAYLMSAQKLIEKNAQLLGTGLENLNEKVKAMPQLIEGAKYNFSQAHKNLGLFQLGMFAPSWVPIYGAASKEYDAAYEAFSKLHKQSNVLNDAAQSMRYQATLAHGEMAKAISLCFENKLSDVENHMRRSGEHTVKFVEASEGARVMPDMTRYRALLKEAQDYHTTTMNACTWVNRNAVLIGAIGAATTATVLSAGTMSPWLIAVVVTACATPVIVIQQVREVQKGKSVGDAVIDGAVDVGKVFFFSLGASYLVRGTFFSGGRILAHEGGYLADGTIVKAGSSWSLKAAPMIFESIGGGESAITILWLSKKAALLAGAASTTTAVLLDKLKSKPLPDMHVVEPVDPSTPFANPLPGPQLDLSLLEVGYIIAGAVTKVATNIPKQVEPDPMLAAKEKEKAEEAARKKQEAEEKKKADEAAKQKGDDEKKKDDQDADQQRKDQQAVDDKQKLAAVQPDGDLKGNGDQNNQLPTPLKNEPPTASDPHPYERGLSNWLTRNVYEGLPDIFDYNPWSGLFSSVNRTTPSIPPPPPTPPSFPVASNDDRKPPSLPPTYPPRGPELANRGNQADNNLNSYVIAERKQQAQAEEQRMDEKNREARSEAHHALDRSYELQDHLQQAALQSQARSHAHTVSDAQGIVVRENHSYAQELQNKAHSVQLILQENAADHGIRSAAAHLSNVSENLLVTVERLATLHACGFPLDQGLSESSAFGSQNPNRSHESLFARTVQRVAREDRMGDVMAVGGSFQTSITVRSAAPQWLAAEETPIKMVRALEPIPTLHEQPSPFALFAKKESAQEWSLTRSKRSNDGDKDQEVVAQADLIEAKSTRSDTQYRTPHSTQQSSEAISKKIDAREIEATGINSHLEQKIASETPPPRQSLPSWLSNTTNHGSALVPDREKVAEIAQAHEQNVITKMEQQTADVTKRKRVTAKKRQDGQAQRLRGVITWQLLNNEMTKAERERFLLKLKELGITEAEYRSLVQKLNSRDEQKIAEVAKREKERVAIRVSEGASKGAASEAKPKKGRKGSKISEKAGTKKSRADVYRQLKEGKKG